ncbi:hypothetical protein EYF80_017446 [Liparis tanakae]|uniref:Uncharacterized protein n=1 Tax=Liparis tanakae TaxID=230148 RepID=A0A4Z2I4S2_9TELE|nr:hypothetical protein EYF80_017446 [Liparis tanakae]
MAISDIASLSPVFPNELQWMGYFLVVECFEVGRTPLPEDTRRWSSICEGQDSRERELISRGATVAHAAAPFEVAALQYPVTDGRGRRAGHSYGSEREQRERERERKRDREIQC